MWSVVTMISVFSVSVSGGPLDEKSGLNSDPFIILAKSAEYADTDHNQFIKTNKKHSKETVEIVTSANVDKDRS